MGKWSLGRVARALLSGGMSEVGSAITNRNPETGEHIGSSGGKKWSVNEAKKFSKKIAGKVETIRRVTNAIIGTDPSAVKPNHKNDFAKLTDGAKQIKTSTEERWTLFQNYQNAGWNDANNRKDGKFHYDKISTMEHDALAMDNKRHIWSTVRDIDKLARIIKTGNLAPLRAVAIISLRLNFMNLATIFKLAQKHDVNKYERQIKYTWLRLGGNRTQWDRAVDAGYKKKPIAAKQMKLAEIGLNFYGTEGQAQPKGDNNNNNNLQEVKRITNQIHNEAEVIRGNAPQDKKYLKIPQPVIAGITPLATAFGATLGAGADRAVSAGLWGSWGGLASAMLETVNAFKIPLGNNDEQFSTSDDRSIPNDLPNEINKQNNNVDWISGVPNVVTGIGTLVVLGGIGYGIYKLTKK